MLLISKAVIQRGRTRVKVLSILVTSQRAFVRKKLIHTSPSLAESPDLIWLGVKRYVSLKLCIMF
jgi:hypothetical protein